MVGYVQLDPAGVGCAELCCAGLGLGSATLDWARVGSSWLGWDGLGWIQLDSSWIGLAALGIHITYKA